MNNSTQLEEIAQRVKAHKQKEIEWCCKREEYIEQFLKLTGQKAAYDFCLYSLRKQIEDVRCKIMAIKGIEVEAPPPPQQENEQNEPKYPVFSPFPDSIQRLSDKTEEKPAPPASPAAAAPVAAPNVPAKEEKPKRKKRASSKSSKSAVPKYTINIHLDSIRAVCFYNSLPIVVSASDDGTIRLTNCEPVGSTGKKLRNPVNFESLRGHSEPVLCLFPYEQNNHQYLLSGCLDGTIALWDLPMVQNGLFDVKGRVDHNKINEFDFHTDAVWSIAADGKHAISCSADGTAKFWLISETPEPVDLPVPSQPVAVKNIEPGKFVVACQKGEVIIFNEETQEKIIEVGSPIYRISDVVDDVFTATCGDQSFLIINICDGSIKKVVASTKRIESTGITSDGECYITTATDREVRVWSSDNNELLFAEVMHKEKFGECGICCATTSQNMKNSYFATGGAEGTLQVYTHN
jgi:striatin 1/3/4